MKKILVIEDQIEIREILVEMLITENFNVTEAENGWLGIKLANLELPDLIICDIMMPEVDGYEVLNHLRENPDTETIPLILLSAKSSQIDIRQGIELGADDYLTKPFTRAELLGAIAARFEKKEAIERQAKRKLDNLRINISHSLPHELHTPLNGIIGMSRLLIDNFDSIEPEEAKKMLDAVYVSGERLYNLTQKFLLYAKTEIIATSTEEVELIKNLKANNNIRSIICETVILKVQKAGREKDLQLNIQNVTIQIQTSKLQTIVEEIIDNTLKFSQPGTNIQVFSQLDDTYQLTFVNYGRGMTTAQIANCGAYMQFERKLYEQQGSGLGLTIVKRLVELHGGKLIIESIPEIETKVHIYLPIYKMDVTSE
jgi:two-component system, sensor histidine kinase and response regulator